MVEYEGLWAGVRKPSFNFVSEKVAKETECDSKNVPEVIKDLHSKRTFI